MFKVGDLVHTRHGIAPITSFTTDGKQAYFEKFLCYQDLKDISLFHLFNVGDWIVSRNKKSGVTYEPFQYSENQRLASGYEPILWKPKEEEWVWFPKMMIPVKITSILEDDYFISNKGIGFESQVYLKDLAPFIGKIPNWLND